MNTPTIANRASGILLHPTSLPGPYGIGDLGPAAYAWVDALARAKQQWWQVLPLSPTGYADSPYQSLSALAGNSYLISPDELIKDGLLNQDDIRGETFPDHVADFDSGRMVAFKTRLLERAWQNLGAAPALQSAFEAFCAEQTTWLDEFALFVALKDAHGGASWLDWDAEYKRRAPEALARARARLASQITQHKFRQFLFARQWRALKEYANARGVRLIGDVPIFVSTDSADVWSNPGCFLLDEHGQPTVVAGVPPDYFSATGQLWGNPLYNWDALRQAGYAWWAARLRAIFNQVDVARIDHFRGFAACWSVPGGDQTAERGQWVQGPGADLFDTLAADLGRLPIIAEDLGVITPDVEALRARYGLPGMRILQFAFAGAVEKRFLPHNYERNTIVYTGTHDNDTTRGWYVNAATDAERAFMRRYMAQDGRDIAWDMIRLAWSSVAVLAVAPLQDVLNLVSDARMNLPGSASGNWRWRFRRGMLTEAVLDRLGELTQVYDRAPTQEPA